MAAYYQRKRRCLDCDSRLEDNVYDYSLEHYKMPLCRPCQSAFKIKAEKSTKDAIELYVALRLRNVPAELEKYDGYKTVDIAVKEAFVHIEVDGEYHLDPKQALTDLKRTYYDFLDGIMTIRVPNSLVRSNLEEAADLITELLSESADDMDLPWKEA